MLYKLIVFGLWRTVESNHADPAREALMNNDYH